MPDETRNPIDAFQYMLKSSERFGKLIQAIDDIVKDVNVLLKWKDEITSNHYITNENSDKRLDPIRSEINNISKNISDNDKLTENIEGRLKTIAVVFWSIFGVVVVQALLFFWKFYPKLMTLQHELEKLSGG